MNTQPRSVRPARVLVGLAAAALGFYLGVLPAEGGVVILKDGYVLHGKVNKEQSVSFQDGVPVVMAKVNALTTVDDGARIVAFSPHYRQVGDVEKDYDRFADQEKFLRGAVRSQNKMPGNAVPKDKVMPEFNKDWRRKLVLTDPLRGGFYEITQQITALTPHYTRVDSTTHMWTTCFLTQELGPERVRKLLHAHPDMVVKDGKVDPDRRMRIVRFLMQAGWLADAEEELTALLKDAPEAKEKVEKARTEIRELMVERTMAEIERAREAGRHRYAREQLKQLPKEGLPTKVAVRAAALQAEYDAMFKQFDSARNLLKELVPGAKDRDLGAAGKAVLMELHPDAVGRVETFVTLAEQAERDLKQGRKPLHSPDELLAAAVSGYLLGKNSTETKTASALRFWYARKMAMEYQVGLTPAGRGELLANYVQNTKTALAFDELAELIANLPPAEAEEDPVVGKPVERETGPAPNLPNGVRFLLQLPPEYHHGRRYPLLILLPTGQMKPSEMLKAFGDLPARFGYIVAIPEWHRGFETSYGYTDEEHFSVTGLLWHLRRKFQVDSDRVFLFGYGEGAKMALDVGAGHPDLFAGVIPMGGVPPWWFYQQTWRNLQQLPMYMISGDLVGDAVVPIRKSLEAMMPKGYPLLVVTYRGRGSEWFGHELPYVFDWMGRKRRTLAVPAAGKSGQEYSTMRRIENRFYWLTADEIAENNLREHVKPPRKPMPAQLAGQILEGNVIHVSTQGVRQVTVWLGKGMVDFDKPVRVKVGNSAYWDNGRKPIVPNLEVLMEDLYQRADRQRPFFEKKTFQTVP